jgi:hypothetical protein
MQRSVRCRLPVAPPKAGWEMGDVAPVDYLALIGLGEDADGLGL